MLRKTIRLTLSGNRLLAADEATAYPTLDAGMQGEDGAVALAFDVPEDWADLTVRIVAVAPGGEYQSEAGSGTVTLELPGALLAHPGRLFVHAEGTDGTSIRKTGDCAFRIHPSAQGVHPVSA